MPGKRNIYAPYPVGELASNFPVYALCPACKHFEIKETNISGFKFRCYGGGKDSRTAFAKARKDNYDFPQEQNYCEKYETNQSNIGQQQSKLERKERQEYEKEMREREEYEQARRERRERQEYEKEMREREEREQARRERKERQEYEKEMREREERAREIGLVRVYVCLPELTEYSKNILKENCKLICSSYAKEEYFIDTEEFAKKASVSIPERGGFAITIPKKNIKNIIKSNKVQEYLANNEDNNMMAIKYHGGFVILPPSSFSNLQLEGNQDDKLKVDATHYLIWIKEEDLLPFLKKYNNIINTIKENFA